jgi:hypothetical protein
MKSSRSSWTFVIFVFMGPKAGPTPQAASYHSNFAPNRIMRGGTIVVGKPNELPET